MVAGADAVHVTFSSALSDSFVVTVEVANNPNWGTDSGYLAITAKSATGFTITHYDSAGVASAVPVGVTVDIDWIALPVN